MDRPPAAFDRLNDRSYLVPLPRRLAHYNALANKLQRHFAAQSARICDNFLPTVMAEYLRLLHPDSLSRITANWTRQDTLFAVGGVVVLLIMAYFVVKRR